MALLKSCAEAVVLAVLKIMLFFSFACGEVDIIPNSDLITTSNTSITYRCLPSVSNAGLTSIKWLLNGSGLENFTNARSAFRSIGEGVGTLELTNIPTEYNATTIQCVATFRPPRPQAFSSIITLFVQGTLSAVGSFLASTEESSVHLTWTAPFTLNIPDTDPDITYCVDVVNSTSSATLHSECGLNGTEFAYSVPSGSGCYDHMIVVTPVNVVGRGEPSSLLFSQTISSLRISQNSRPFPSLQATGVLHYTIIMNAPVCFAELTLTEQFSKQVIRLAPSEIVTMGLRSVSFTSARLTLNRNYRGILNASNVKESELSDLEISTHDIISVFIETVPLRIQAEYVSNSSAAGGLFMFLFFSGDDSTAVDFSKSAFVFLDQNTSRSGHVMPFQLPPGQYSVSAYDIEEGGEMDSGTLYPADTTVHSQRGTQESAYQPVMSSNIEDCNVTVTNRQNISTLIVSALCTHAANSLSSEAGFVMIVQRNDININRAVQLLVNETRQGSPEGPVSVQVEENGIYHVAIFPRNVERGIVNSDLAYSVQVSTIPAVNVEDVEDEPSSPPPSATSTIIITDDRESVAFHSIKTTPKIGVDIVLALLIAATLGCGLSHCVSVVLGVLMAVTLAVIVLVARYKKSASTPSMPHCHESANNYKEVNSEAKSPDIGVYAEIGDVKSSFSYTQNMLYESSLVSHTTQPLCMSMGGQQPDKFMISPSMSHDYEVDRLAHKKTEVNDDDPFLLGQCSAYGTGPVPASDEIHRSSLTQNVAYETTEAASRSRNDTSSGSDSYLVRQCSAYGSGLASNREMN